MNHINQETRSEKSKKLNQNDRNYTPYADTLSLGDEYILKCSNCGTNLCTILVTRPKLKVIASFQAMCWKCGDCSFPIDIHGGIHMTKTKQSIINTIRYVGDDQAKVIIDTIANIGGDDGL